MSQVLYCKCVVVAMIVFMAAPVCAAKPHPLAELSLEACTGISSPEVERIFQVELHSILAGRERVAPATCSVTVTCGQDVVDIETIATPSGIRRGRRIDMSTGKDNGSGRERLIAITAAELVLDCLTPVSEKIPVRRKTPAPPPLPSPAPQTRRDTAISVAVSKPAGDLLTTSVLLSAFWQIYLDGGVHLFGGRAGGVLFLKQMLFFELDLDAAGGRVHFPAGDVSVLKLNAALLIGTNGALRARPIRGGLAAGFRNGYCRLGGHAASPSVEADVVHGGCGGPYFRLFGAVGRRLGAGVSVDLGYDVYGTVGGVPDGDAIRLKGLWLSVQVDLLYFLRS